MFETRYRQHRRFNSDVGSREKVLYSPVFDRNGVMHLEESGRENLYDFIQSHRDSVDIHKLLERFASGDVSAFQRREGTYGDFTEMPKTYAELLNTVVNGERTFDSLSREVRERFGNSFHQWLAQAGTPDWFAAMGLVSAEPEPLQKSQEPPVELAVAD